MSFMKVDNGLIGSLNNITASTAANHESSMKHFVAFIQTHYNVTVKTAADFGEQHLSDGTMQSLFQQLAFHCASITKANDERFGKKTVLGIFG